jgi:hypothetical protein
MLLLADMLMAGMSDVAWISGRTTSSIPSGCEV